MAAFTNAKTRMVIPATGGKGAAQLLPLLDFDVISANPKVFTGMSDPSILVNAISACAGVRALHGPSGFDFYQDEVDARTEAAFWRIVTSPIAGDVVRGSDWRIVRGAGREVSGTVVGGHLGTNRALVGTKWMPAVDGAIVLIEEAFVPWVRLDEALTHLRLAGMFDHVGALMIGVPADCPRDDAPDESLEELVVRCVGGDFPIVSNVEFGHTPTKIPFVIGGRASLNLTGAEPVLTYRDDLVSPDR
jgi:muramoyltetrapeptide carboxypeptidase